MANQWSESALSLQTNSQNANAAENLGALFTWNTMQTANAQDQTTQKMMGGISKKKTESSMGYAQIVSNPEQIISK